MAKENENEYKYQCEHCGCAMTKDGAGHHSVADCPVMKHQGDIELLLDCGVTSCAYYDTCCTQDDREDNHCDEKVVKKYLVRINSREVVSTLPVE